MSDVLADESLGVVSADLGSGAGAGAPQTYSLPEETRSRVSVQPPAGWVKRREVAAPSAEAGLGSGCVLLWDLQADAESHAEYCRIVRVLDTPELLMRASQWQVEFDPRIQTLAVHSLAIVRGGERMEQAGMDRLRLLQREGRLEALALSGSVTVMVLLEDVRLGDQIDASFTIVTRGRILPDKFHRLIGTEFACGVREFFQRVIFAKGRPMRWKASPESFAPEVLEGETEVEWTWKLTDVKRAPAAEVRAPAVPPAGWIQVSDVESWALVAEHCVAAWREYLEQPALLAMAREIAAAAQTPEERAARAVEFVQDEIRYLSVREELGGQVPQPPEVVLRRRFGDCKDKSFLLAHLLRLLGIPARPFLVHSLWRGWVRDLLPSADVFDHVGVEYAIGSERRWVDATTAQQGGRGLQRAAPRFVQGLPLGPGVSALEKLPGGAPIPTYSLQESFRLHTTGRPITLQVLLMVTGDEADALRAALANRSEAEFAEARLSEYRGSFSQIRRLAGPETRDDRVRNELLLGERFEIPIDMGSRGSLENLHVSYRSYPILRALAPPPAGERREVWRIGPRMVVEHQITLDTPTLPEAGRKFANEENQWFKFSTGMTGKFGRWVVRYRLEILQPVVAAADLNRYGKIVTRLAPALSFTLLLPGGHGAMRSRASDPLLPALPVGRPAAVSADAVEAALPEKPGSVLESLVAEPEPAVAPAPVVAAARPSVESRETVSAEAPVRRHRHRRRRSWLAQNWWWMLLAAALAVLFMLIVVVDAVSAKRDGRPVRRGAVRVRGDAMVS
jgi:hypothetical protein